MGLLQGILGPRSKYDKTIPYLYEARIAVSGLEDTFHSYMADTVCALIDRLHEDAVDPSEVRIYEVYQDRETEIENRFWRDAAGKWVFKPALCQAFEAHYKGHIHGTRCSFADRDKKGVGPY